MRLIRGFDHHLFLDRSSVEVFAQRGRYPFTALIYPDVGSDGLYLRALGGNITVSDMRVYRLSSAYER